MIINSKYNFLIPFKVKKLIRLGRNFDGGYLVCKNTLKYCENLITLGVGDDISFEKDFYAKNNNAKIFLYDYTVNHLLFLRIILKYLRRLITFRTKLDNLIYSIKNYFNFINLVNQGSVSLFRLRVVRKIRKGFDIQLSQIFKKIKSKNNLLKIDIEGSEYEIIEDIIKNDPKINMLIIEFHWINNYKKKFINSIKKLKKKFDIIHLHVNNYRTPKINEDIFDVIEISFIKKKFNKNKSQFRTKFPIKNLDFECFPNHKNINFIFKK